MTSLCSRPTLAAVLLLCIAAAGCSREASPTPAGQRLTLAGVGLGDSAESVETRQPAPNCEADIEAESDDPAQPKVCDVSFAYDGRTVSFYAGISNGRVESVYNTDLGAEDIRAVSRALHAELGAPSAVEKAAEVQEETWQIGAESLQVKLDSAYGGGSIVLSGRAAPIAPTSASAQPQAAQAQELQNSLKAPKPFAWGMTPSQVIEAACSSQRFQKITFRHGQADMYAVDCRSLSEFVPAVGRGLWDPRGLSIGDASDGTQPANLFLAFDQALDVSLSGLRIVGSPVFLDLEFSGPPSLVCGQIRLGREVSTTDISRKLATQLAGDHVDVKASAGADAVRVKFGGMLTRATIRFRRRTLYDPDGTWTFETHQAATVAWFKEQFGDFGSIAEEERALTRDLDLVTYSVGSAAIGRAAYAALPYPAVVIDAPASVGAEVAAACPPAEPDLSSDPVF